MINRDIVFTKSILQSDTCVLCHDILQKVFRILMLQSNDRLLSVGRRQRYISRNVTPKYKRLLNINYREQGYHAKTSLNSFIVPLAWKQQGWTKSKSQAKDNMWRSRKYWKKGRWSLKEKRLHAGSKLALRFKLWKS